jgi:tetratricopeptide (TPR) repeat protein
MKRFTFSMFCLGTALLCPIVLLAQGMDRPKITNIPGGFFVEWSSPVEVAAIKVDKKLAGPFEVMFDVPNVDFITRVLDNKTPASRGHEITTALADYWMVRGRPERAIPLYEDSLKQGGLDDKREMVFQNNLAMLYSQVLKDHAKALALVESALETRKDNTILLDTQGLIHLNNGDPASAIPPLQRAVELSCQLPIYCMHLAYALHMDGRDGQARRYFDNVRPQLTEAVPKMGKENKAMFDRLQDALPPLNTQ